MSPVHSPSESHLPKRWKLWVDGCGGYLLLNGDRHRIGSGRTSRWADVHVKADLARTCGSIEREASDYFWQLEGDTAASKQWLASDSVIDLSRSAKLRVKVPSPLCHSAVLSLSAPHRFGEHVDEVILVDQTFLLGPSLDCHIRVRENKETAVVAWRNGGWEIRGGLGQPWHSLVPSESVQVGQTRVVLELGTLEEDIG